MVEEDAEEPISEERTRKSVAPVVEGEVEEETSDLSQNRFYFIS